MDFLDLKSIKSIIHGFEMDLDLQIKTPWTLDGFGFTKEIHEIREFRSTILIIRNDDKLIILIQWKPLNRDTFFGTNSFLTIEITSDNRDSRIYGTKT